MKELKYIFKSMAKYEPSMYLLIVLYSIFIGLKPFIWIISPAYILKNYQNGLDFMLGFFILLLVLSTIISFFESFIMGTYRMKMNNIRYKYMNMVTKYALYLPYEEKTKKSESEKINSANKAVDSPYLGAGAVMMTLPEFLASLTSIAGFLWIFLKIGGIILSLIITLTIISTYIANKIPREFSKFWNDQNENYNKFTKLNNELRSPLSKQDILIFDFINVFKSFYKKTNQNRIAYLVRTDKKTFKIYSLVRLINFIRDALIMYWLITNLMSGNLDLGDFYVYFTAILAFVNFNNLFMWIFNDFFDNLTRFKPFFKIINPYQKSFENKNLPKNLKIDLVNLSFKYPNSDKYVLKNINLTINNNESIALVGENGAGKSTLALILAGFYKSYEGEIFINGKNFKKLDYDYNSLVSAVFQDSQILPFSIKENILLNDSNKNLEKTYGLTHLNKIIESYDKKDKQTLLRILDDDGVDLSGGQKQKLYLARSIEKNSSKLLILDEPTAQLDALAERELYTLYNDLTKNKSSIFISHRLASTKFCNRIVYLKDGKIKSTGSHEELMKNDSDYKDLYNLQAKNYKEKV
ncbi:ATP-binding cassette domain-containing protein [Anaerococcus vaginalis]|uniref:ATP-binding cassette domain-containing protein n=1 Tax=Anaerococcus vaginalis TaxID=33037 RepID=UPI0024332098|nr:ABC transporter ATP-binding protein [Anaerococcus vaginalis]MBS6921061.1 ABC transporter ATP-binding protein [Anaerococcus vaginalis]MDU5988112.1 ABC transporter ATP-binding protein [Anaerococcus vaginalis]